MTNRPRAHPANLSMIEKRRIEAEMLSHVYNVLKDNVGVEIAQQTIGEAVRRSSVEQAQRFAAEAELGTSLDTFVEATKLWETDDELQIAVKERSETTYAFDVIRCRYAEMYKAMGLGEIGHLLSCQRDGTFCQGYDPKLKLTRTQTIMQGAACCDFRYVYENTGEGAAGEVGPGE
jgi:hypothetical protein